MERIKSADLRERAALLPTVIESAWADSTNQKYSRGWEQWISWCKRYPESKVRPADPFFVALFINDMVIDEAKKGRIETAYLGVRWGHIIVGMKSPTEHPFVKTAFEGAKRIASRNTSKNRKEPMDTELLGLLFDKYGDSGNIMHTRFSVICFLGFAGFLRISELQDVKMKHVTFKSDHMQILIEKCKTDQQREGEVVYVCKLGRKKCPVAITEKYVKMTNLDKKQESFLICRLAKTKKSHNALGKYPLSYSRIRENFLELVDSVSEGIFAQLWLHSLRSVTLRRLITM